MAYVLLIAAILCIGLLFGWGLGGGLRNLADLRIRFWPALPVALALQVVPVPRLEGRIGSSLPFGVLLLSFAVLAGVVLVNWRLRWFPVILAGLVLNIVPIVLNRGMPVSAEAVVTAGGSVDDVPTERGAKNHLETTDDDLTFLADTIAVREPFGTVVSVGDVLMYGGAAGFLAAAMLGRSERVPRRAAARSRRIRPATMWGSQQ